ncbi:MAG: PLP-dependent aminotransferase family protein [Defluviitaleaceae bacterium]|nr:PLP-dependent aminotransferase family protein [Defluviitaleaceae bacterium]
MNQPFSKRVESVAPASVYEILKHCGPGKAIAFAAGNPGADAIPQEAIAKYSAEALQMSIPTTLLYAPTEGYPPLREKLTAHLKQNDNMGGVDDDLIITSGATQGIELITKVFCNEGDVVISENPSFVGSLSAFQSYGVDLVGVDMEHDGMCMEELEHALQTNKNARFIYTIPNFQNPTGWTTSLEKRKKIYELAKKYNTLILEDDPYGYLRYFGESIPNIKSFDTDGIVLYAGSFSKTISPGLRVGYLMAHKNYMAKLAAAKQVSDVHSPSLPQIIVHKFMEDFTMEQQLADICAIYKRRLQLACDCIDKYMGGRVSYVKPEGGLYVYVQLPDDVDTSAFCKQALTDGVGVIQGSSFGVDPTRKSPFFRINFSSPSDELLEKGIQILGETLKKF